VVEEVEEEQVLDEMTEEAVPMTSLRSEVVDVVEEAYADNRYMEDTTPLQRIIIREVSGGSERVCVSVCVCST